VSCKAYEHCLRGRSEYYLYTPDHLVAALTQFQAAISLDPDYAEAYAYQSYCRCTLHVFAWPGADTTLDPAENFARKAVALDPGSAIAHARLGWVLAYRDRLDETVASFETALTLDPNSAEVHQTYAESMNRAGRPDRALSLIERAFSIDTFVPPSWEFVRGHAHVLRGDLPAAIDSFTQVLDRVPGFVPARVQLARALHESQRPQDARAEIATLQMRAPRYTTATAQRMFPYPQTTERARLTDALVAAGLPTTPKQHS